MDFVIPDGFNPDSILASAKVRRVQITRNNTLEFRDDLVKGKDYKLVQMSPDFVMIGENFGGEIIFEDALEIPPPGSHDAKTLEALRVHRLDTKELVTLMAPLHTRDPLPIPKGCHKSFWAYTLK